MTDILLGGAILIVWIVLQKYVFPKIGVGS
jgi:hypothetical protein